MDMYEALAARKTIRDFAPQPIAMDTARKIIAAGMLAPSNNHMREWHFILLQDKEQRKVLLDRVIKPTSTRGAIGLVNRWGLTDVKQRQVYIDAIPKQYNMLFSCGLLIIPCYLQPGQLLRPKDLSALNAFASIWACIENILLAAAAEGIFGVTRIPFESERKVMKEYLGLPEGYEIPCWMALGFPSESAQRIPQVEIDLNERIHLNNWQN